MLRITRPRVEVLDVLYRIGGEIHHPEGRVVAQIAAALDYTGSLTGLKRVLGALDEHGLITRESRAGRVHTITLTEAGEQLLRDRGLIDDSPRRFLIDERTSADRAVLELAVAAIGQRLQGWVEEADLSRPIEDLRFGLTLILHDDIEPRVPDEEEIAVLVARARVALGNLLDIYVSDPTSVDVDLVDSALKVILDARLPLIAWHKALTGSEDALEGP